MSARMWRVDLEHDILGELHTDWTSNHGAQEMARQLTRDMPTWRVTLTGQVRDELERVLLAVVEQDEVDTEQDVHADETAVPA